MDVEAVRKEFPILKREVHGKPLVYLDSAATSQKPLEVIETLNHFYRTTNANIHRGIYLISEEATALYEGARKKVARFLGARSWREVIFTRSATEAINLVAYAWGRENVKAGDVILLTEMEHHSNLIPWQLLAKEKEARLEFIRFDNEGHLQLEDLDTYLKEKVKIVALTQMSNVLGTINPVKEITKRAHDAGAVVLVDGAQSVPHMRVNVQEIGCDFLAFSGHKMCGPSGIGGLYGRKEILEKMNPFLGGGEMILEVTLRDARWNELPYKFEAGTQSIADGIGLGKAVDFLNRIGLDAICEHERELVEYAMNRLNEVEGVKIYGPHDEERGSALAITLEGVHPHDLASLLDAEGIAVRAGHHCTMPLHQKLEVPATTRASFYLYNTKEEVDKLVEGLRKSKELFGI
ncbi:cysteine desulfurase [candidate division TA06 bacterium]|nr:cysteine desulfurase [candidate division TA06 bacterium]